MPTFLISSLTNSLPSSNSASALISADLMGKHLFSPTISAFQWGPHWALRLVKFLWIFLKPLFSLWIRRFHPTSHTYWFRYMDDILCLWHGSATDLSLLFDVMNNMFPSIKFTIEHAEVNLSTFWTLLFLLLMESTSSPSTGRIHLRILLLTAPPCAIPRTRTPLSMLTFID